MHDHERQLCPDISGADAIAPARGRAGWSWRSTRAAASFRRPGRSPPGPIPLPGGAAQWPLDVKVDGKAAAATAGDDDKEAPRVRVAPGRHTVTGTFVWSGTPRRCRCRRRLRCCRWRWAGARSSFKRSEAGVLFLRKDGDGATPGEADALDITVHRRLTDDMPALLATRIALNVAGKTREIRAGQGLPRGFAPQALSRSFPSGSRPTGASACSGARPSPSVTLLARHEGAVRRSRAPIGGPWKDGEEVWVFEARPALRAVTVTGVTGVDPQQTTLPTQVEVGRPRS